MYFCYILYSKKLDLFYKGFTANIGRRIDKHNKGDVTFTAKGKPWILVWYTQKSTKSEALNLERKLKNLGRKRIIQFIKKHDEGVPIPDAAELIGVLTI